MTNRSESRAKGPTRGSAIEWVSPVALARVHIGLGENEEALAELERAYEERAYRIVTNRHPMGADS
jgi:hypothetical protein